MDGNRTRRTEFIRPNRVEDGGAHQALGHLHFVEYREHMVTPARELSTTALTDGLTVVVKRDCETCQMVEAAIAAIASSTPIRVITQDDPSFPASVEREHDDDLAFSWHHDIETVPTLIKVDEGARDS